MWAAWMVAAIALAAVAFMLRFLVALLREGAPCVCYWVVPVRGEREGETLEALSVRYVEDECRARDCDRSEYNLEFLENENENDAKQECVSDLIALNVRPASASLGRRSIHKGVCVLRERRL